MQCMGSYKQAKLSRDAGSLLVAADWLNQVANATNEAQTPPKKKRRGRKESKVGVGLDSPTRKTALQVESIISQKGLYVFCPGSNLPCTSAYAPLQLDKVYIHTFTTFISKRSREKSVVDMPSMHMGAINELGANCKLSQMFIKNCFLHHVLQKPRQVFVCVCMCLCVLLCAFVCV